MTCYKAICHGIWLQNFISTLGVVHFISISLKLFCNNSIAISFSRNTSNTFSSKRIDAKFYFVEEIGAKSLISVEHTPITSMLTDPLTKGLHICVFQEHVTRMGLLGA